MSERFTPATSGIALLGKHSWWGGETAYLTGRNRQPGVQGEMPSTRATTVLNSIRVPAFDWTVLPLPTVTYVYA